MPKKRNVGDDIIRGLEEAIAYARGEAVPVRITEMHVPDEIDVKAIRRKFGLTQPEFARRFGFALTAVQEWEKRRRKPDRAARLFLKVIDREPEAVERALRG